MFTIIAWIVFFPALVLNVIAMAVIFGELMGLGTVKWDARSYLQLIIIITLPFIPGVYLFGWF